LTPILGEPLLRLAFAHYDTAGLEKLLKANLPALTLRQLASAKRKFVVVPSFQINGGDATPGARWRTVLFHNLPNLARAPDFSQTSLVNTAMCSAAAPLYFDPRTIKEGQFVDGGLSANDPCSAAIAAVLASSLAAPGGLTPKSIVAVSIGTGNVLNNFPGPSTSSGFLPKSFGIFGWLNPSADGRAPEFPLIEAMFAGSNGINDLIASMLLRDSTYIRVNPTFNRSSTWSLDDCEAIPDMIAQTQLYIASTQWKNFARRINAI
jgi:predicted acylesterase/phospholipase RssA